MGEFDVIYVKNAEKRTLILFCFSWERNQGLAVLEKQIKEKHNKLTSCISVGKPISTEDEDWLDNGGNTIEEVHAIDALEKEYQLEGTAPRQRSHLCSFHVGKTCKRV